MTCEQSMGVWGLELCFQLATHSPGGMYPGTRVSTMLRGDHGCSLAPTLAYHAVLPPTPSTPHPALPSFLCLFVNLGNKIANLSVYSTWWQPGTLGRKRNTPSVCKYVKPPGASWVINFLSILLDSLEKILVKDRKKTDVPI